VAGLGLPAHDFVLTRTMEVLVPSDDLASSIGVDTPAFPDQAADAALALLASLAAWRHGQVAVLRVLSRPPARPRPRVGLIAGMESLHTG
jgi:hypothetical protein